MRTSESATRGGRRELLLTLGFMLIAAVALCLAPLLVGCYSDVKVVQGTVVRVDRGAQVIDVKDERSPNAVAPYRLARPATVKDGDLVRLAYRATGDDRVALRLMNLTRLKERRRSEKE